jgi:hypothetical protein
MITQDEFLAVAEAKPEMKRAFQAAVYAVVELRREAAKNKNGLWAQFKLKRRGVRAVFLTNRFISGFVFDGHPASKQDKELIRGWILGAADFHVANSN